MRSLLSALILAGTILLMSACGAAPQAAPQAAAPQAAAPQAAAPQGGYTTISVADLKARLDKGDKLVVLDVRTPEEYTQDKHIAGSTLMPLADLPQRMGELQKDQAIACFCRSGNRSRAACDQLAQAGYTNLLNVDGGIRAWVAAGYPVE